jgi:hypothetical protein
MLTFLKSKKVRRSSPLSDFVRNASSAHKKKVYVEVINRAIEEQRRIVEKAKEAPSTKAKCIAF